MRLIAGIVAFVCMPWSIASSAIGKTGVQTTKNIFPAEELVGKPAPEFQLTTADGKTLDNKSLSETSAAVLTFWAGECPYSKKALLRIESLVAEFVPKDVRFINVAETMRKTYTNDELKGILGELRIKGELAPDQQNTVGPKFKVTSYPTIFVLGKSGKIEGVAIGNKADLEDDITKALNTALGIKKPDTKKADKTCDLTKLALPVQSSLAVLDFYVGEGVNRDASWIMADAMRQAVLESGAFTLITREAMKQLLDEEDLAATVQCDKTQCLVDYGKKLRAQKIVHGKLAVLDGTWHLTLQLLDVSTGKTEALQQMRSTQGVTELIDMISTNEGCELLHDALTEARK